MKLDYTEIARQCQFGHSVVQEENRKCFVLIKLSLPGWAAHQNTLLRAHESLENRKRGSFHKCA